MGKLQTNWLFGGIAQAGMPGVFVYDDWRTFDFARALAEVSAERRNQALRFRFERDQWLSVAAYLLLKEALGKVYGLKGNPHFAFGPNGKPYLPDHPEIHFNLSHCPKAVACAVANVPVGIDVEVIAPIDEAVVRRVLSSAEQNALWKSDEPDTTFARYWTEKEALVKLTGEGIDDGDLPGLLATVRDIHLDTAVNRERGYVLTLARQG